MAAAGAAQQSQWAGGSWEESWWESSGNGRRPGGEWALGVGLALANHRPRCSRILRITSGFSIAATYVKLHISGIMCSIRLCEVVNR